LPELTSTSGLVPVAAIGIVVGLLAMITLLPALLVIFGRWLFWPVRPKAGSAEPTATGAYAPLGAGWGCLPRPPRAGRGQPITVIANAAQADQVRLAFAATPGISAVGAPV